MFKAFMNVELKSVLFSDKDCVLIFAVADGISDKDGFDGLHSLEISGAAKHIERYKKVADRNRSSMGLMALQKCLEYFDIVPSSARLYLLNSGKPVLDNGIKFNISHSDNIAVCIAHRRLAVGVDIERIEPNTSNADLRLKVARRLFTDTEQRGMLECDAPEAEFTRLWTLREAVGKCLGVGIFRGDVEKYVLGNGLAIKSFYLPSDLSFDADTVYENLFDGASYVMTVCIDSRGEDREGQ